MQVRIGRMKRRITIERAVDATNATNGESIRTWSQVADRVPAAFAESQTESEQASKITRKASGTFTIRFRSDVDQLCRLVMDGRTFAVSSVVDPDERRAFLVITATEVN
jgi:SPP1 family predicted phage head-tail adaptor